MKPEDCAEIPTRPGIRIRAVPIELLDVAPVEAAHPALTAAAALAEYSDTDLEDLAYAGRLAEDELFRRGRR